MSRLSEPDPFLIAYVLGALTVVSIAFEAARHLAWKASDLIGHDAR